MDLPDLPQLINLDLSKDEILCVDDVDASCLDKTLQEADFGDFFRYVRILFFFVKQNLRICSVSWLYVKIILVFVFGGEIYFGCGFVSVVLQLRHR